MGQLSANTFPGPSNVGGSYPLKNDIFISWLPLCGSWTGKHPSWCPGLSLFIPDSAMWFLKQAKSIAVSHFSFRPSQTVLDTTKEFEMSIESRNLTTDIRHDTILHSSAGQR